jgi:hypothetical protein
MKDWHLEDKAEEMRMRMLGKMPRCNQCRFRNRGLISHWCEHKKEQPKIWVSHGSGSKRSYCGLFIEHVAPGE